MSDLTKVEVEKVIEFHKQENIEHREKVAEQLEQGIIEEDAGIDIPIEDVINQLPDSLALAICSVHERTKLPLELCLQTALACANLVTQPHYNVDPIFWPSTALTEFFIVLQERSGGKSTVFREFFKPLEVSRAVRQQTYNLEMDQFKLDEALYKKDIAKGNAATKPEHPSYFWPIVSSPTLNGLITRLQNSSNAGIISDEGTKFINSYSNQSAAGGQGLAANLCNLWNGAPIERLTGVDDNHINNRRCNLFLMVQKVLAAKLVSNDIYNAGGLESRLLVIDSPSWHMAENLQELSGNIKDMDAYYKRITDLFMKPLDVSQFDNKQLAPTILRWDADAKVAASEAHFANNIARNKIDSGNTGYGDGIISKGYEHMLKLAGTICAYDDRHSISIQDWTAASILVDFYVQQRIKIGQVIDPDRVGKMAKAEDDVFRWIQKITKNKQEKSVYQSSLEANGPVSYTKYLEPNQRQQLLIAMVQRELIEFDGKFIKLCD